MSEYLQRRQAIKLGIIPQQGPKEKKPLKPMSDKRAAAMKAEKEALAGGDSPKEQWFHARRLEMTGVCLFCGGKTERNNDLTFRHSIAHIFAKKDNFGGFPSVAIHPDNWIELCYYGNSCHSNFDNGIITWETLRDSAEWEIIVAKFKRIYPYISLEERKLIPEILLNELDKVK